MYKLKQILTGATFALITGLATMSGNAIAMTPDGETPANENICDDLQGGSPGLYGLCVAYCEAQDLSAANESPPSLKILENYRKKMQAGDSDMPCVKPNCPCWTEDELNSIEILACPRTGTDKTQALGPSEVVDGIIIKTHYAIANDTARPGCDYTNTLTSNVFRHQNTTSDQAAVCLIQVEAACAKFGK